MTALKKYARLEASGLWRPNPEAQRREVVVSIGEATLIISDLNDRALTHWSLAAIERKNLANEAIFHPDGDPSETLELAMDDQEMIAAIDTLRRAVARTRPRPGRLRGLGAILSVAAVAALVLFWLPGALRDHALRVLPPVKQQEIGNALLQRITRVTGAPCKTSGSENALARLSARTGVERLVVLPGGIRDTLYLPGGIVALNRVLVEDHETPDVAAGYILAELERNARASNLKALLDTAGLRGTATLLATGYLPARTLDAFAETTLSALPASVPDHALLERFSQAGLSSAPYAYAVDITGETTIALIEADPIRSEDAQPIMPDGDWVRLQSICGT